MVPDTSVGYTGGIYPTGVVRYGLNTLPNTPVWFGTNSIPVPDTSVRVHRGYLSYRSGSVRPQYSTEHSGMVWYELDTGTRHFGKFGTTSIPVPHTSVSSARPPMYTPGTGIPSTTIPGVPAFVRYRDRHSTEHTNVKFQHSTQTG